MDLIHSVFGYTLTLRQGQGRLPPTSVGKPFGCLTRIINAPNIFLLAISTAVSLIALSFVLLFLSAISAASSVSLFLSSASRSFSASKSPEDEDFGKGGDSYIRLNSTKTDGTRVVCFRIQIGAMRPSGWRGDVGVRGDRGECVVMNG